MTTPDPRWTPETEELVAQGLTTGLEAHGHWQYLTPKQRAQQVTYARRALASLADAGLLVTPELAALREAARAFVEADRAMMAAGVEASTTALTATSDRIAALGTAVDAEARTTGAGT
jgi:hypothetical protein